MSFSKKNLVVVGLILILVILWFVNYIYFKQGPQKSKAAGETVDLYFSQTSANAGVNADFTTTIKVKPSIAMNIRGYQFNVNFDKTKVAVKDIAYKLGALSEGLGDDNSKITSVNQAGVIKIVGQSNLASGNALSNSTDAEVVTVIFTSSAVAAYSVTIESSSIKFYMIATDGTLSQIPGPAAGATGLTLNLNGSANLTGTPVPTPTGTVTGNVTLNLKLKFQGIPSKPADQYNKMSVQVVAVSSTGVKSDPGRGDFTAGNDGVWSGSMGLNVTSPGSGFKLLVKGPKHIQKKVCDAAPTETSDGTYHCTTGNITMNAGSNSFDFSKITLLAGDLPTQDGIVNSYDVSLVRNNLGKNDAATLALCDINLDGSCDTQDYSLMIFALSNRGDEE